MRHWNRDLSNGSGMMERFTNIRNHWTRALAVLIFPALVIFVSGAEIAAEEPAEKFLKALRDRGYFDVAIRYLDGVGDSDVVPEAFKKRVKFEKAQILIDSVASVRNLKEQDRRLDESDQLLSAYAATVADPLKSTEVLKLQANVRYFRGRNYLNQATSGKASPAQTKELFSSARKLLDVALPKFREVQKSQRDQIENFQIDPEDPKSDENLRELQASYVDTRLKIPFAMEKLALAYDDDAATRKTKLIEAGEEYDAVAKLYDQRFVQGQMAKAFAARCFQQSADYARASTLLKEVFDYPNPPKLLVREGLNVGVETWPNLEPYPSAEVIKCADQAVQLLNRREKADPGWLRIQLELARAKYMRSLAVKEKNASAASSLKRDASRMAREVARRKNPHSKMAAELLGSWGVTIEAAGEVKVVATAPATSFDDARQKSKDLVAPLSGQLRELTAAQRKLATLTGAEKSDQQLVVDGLETAISTRADQALAMLAQAVQFSDDETPRSEMNNIRFLQANCYFAKKRYLETAVMGKFLLEKYPTIEWSQQAAGLMVRSYERLFDTTTDDIRAAAKRKVIESATSMMDVWPDSDQSSSAAVSATRVAVIDGDFEAAKAFFENIPQTSSTRGQLASRIGQQIWGGRKSATNDQELQEQTQRAKEFLEISVEGVDPATMSFSTAVSVLYYVDACRESGELDVAIPQIDGLLENLDTNEAISKSAKFRRSVYNTALNVYLAAMSSTSNAKDWIDKSKLVMEKMGAEAAGDPEALKKVSSVYRKVASDLEVQFQSLPGLEKKKQFADSLSSFFGGIGSVAKDGKTRLWAGSTLLGIAESLKLEGASDKSKELSSQAVGLLESAKKAGFGNEKGLELNYQHQRAIAQRESGDYKAAVESFEKILESSNGLNIQIDAAKTLLFWGIEKKNTKVLANAMNGRGDYRDPKTKKPRKRILGWNTLTSITRNNKKFLEQFRECQYYSVLCRFRFGQIDGKPRQISSARGELEKALKRFNNLAVGMWKTKYNQLQKELEGAKGAKATKK